MGGQTAPRRELFTRFRATQISSDGHCRAHSSATCWKRVVASRGGLQLVQRLDLEAGLAQQADHLAVGEVELDGGVGVVPLDAVEAELRPREALGRDLAPRAPSRASATASW